jgi:PAS domain S-box-containing protein
MTRVAAGGETHLIGKTAEFAGQRKDGSEFPLELSLSQWQTAEGWFCSAIIRDISTRKQTEQQLLTLQLRTQHYLNVVNVMLLVLDAHGQVLLVNRKGCEMLGYPESDILGKNWFENFIPERMRNEVTEFYTQFLNGSLDLVEHVEHMVLTSAGERFFAWHNSILLDDTGEIDGVMSSAEDITERKRLENILRESEARYKRITDELTDYQYTVRIENGNAVQTIQSPACVTVTGYTPEDFSADPYLWIQMVAPEDRDKVREHVQQILTGQDIDPIELRIIRKDGELRWVRDTTIPLRDISGNLLSYDGVIKDITERKQAEFELAEQLDELRRWHDTTLGRETRILDLKHEINELLGRAGQPPRYPSAESQVL